MSAVVASRLDVVARPSQVEAGVVGVSEALGRQPSAVTALLHGEREIKAREVPIIRAYLELDGTYRIKYQPDSNRIFEFRELGARGYGDRLLLGTDSGKRGYQKAYGAVTGMAAGVGAFSRGLRRTQTGFVRSYALYMFAGATVVVGALVLVTLCWGCTGDHRVTPRRGHYLRGAGAGACHQWWP